MINSTFDKDLIHSVPSAESGFLSEIKGEARIQSDIWKWYHYTGSA